MRAHGNSVNLIILLTIKPKMVPLGGKKKQIFKTMRGNLGGLSKAYDLSKHVCIVSSSGTLVHGKQRS